MTGEKGGNMDATRIQCYHCDREQFVESMENIKCSGCNYNLNPERAMFKYLEGTGLVKFLAPGPKGSSELDTTTGRIPNYPIIDSLRPIHSRKEDNIAEDYGRGESVYYLIGDEREAVRKFIELNEEYVNKVLGERSNKGLQIIESYWSRDMVTLLKQQWEWNQE